jgi:hypothetical protein
MENKFYHIDHSCVVKYLRAPLDVQLPTQGFEVNLVFDNEYYKYFFYEKKYGYIFEDYGDGMQEYPIIYFVTENQYLFLESRNKEKINAAIAISKCLEQFSIPYDGYKMYELSIDGDLFYFSVEDIEFAEIRKSIEPIFAYKNAVGLTSFYSIINAISYTTYDDAYSAYLRLASADEIRSRMK